MLDGCKIEVVAAEGRVAVVVSLGKAEQVAIEDIVAAYEAVEILEHRRGLGAKGEEPGVRLHTAVPMLMERARG